MNESRRPVKPPRKQMATPPRVGEVLFTVERRETIGEVCLSEHDGDNPIMAGMAIIAEAIARDEDGSYQFVYGDVLFKASATPVPNMRGRIQHGDDN